MSTIDRGLAVPRRAVRWTSDHPFRTAGGIAAGVALGVAALSLDVGAGGLTTDAVAGFAFARPAYPAAVVVGLGLLLFAR